MNYRFLGRTGVLVSDVSFGVMTFGGKGFWEAIGKVEQDGVNALIKTAFDGGVNFFDNANAYSLGEAEVLFGNAIRSLGLSRQELVIATKARIRQGKGVNQVGLTRLHLMDAVNDSLKRMNIDHIDLFYIHGVDAYTPLDETMRGLEDIVRSGKVRYLGCCNLMAWQVMKANGISEKNGWTRFEALQDYYAIASRDVEREVVPLAVEEHLSLLPWSPLAGGLLSGKFTRDNQKGDGGRRANFDFPPVDKEKAFNVIDELIAVGKARGVSAAQIAIAWLLHQRAVTSVIVGAKTPEQLTDTMSASALKLSDEELKRLDAVSALTKEYPEWMIERQAADRFVK
jgi:aryl-alcohol dehydrogenase-like predicted oxidoreductase